MDFLMPQSILDNKNLSRHAPKCTTLPAKLHGDSNSSRHSMPSQIPKQFPSSASSFPFFSSAIASTTTTPHPLPHPKAKLTAGASSAWKWISFCCWSHPGLCLVVRHLVPILHHLPPTLHLVRTSYAVLRLPLLAGVPMNHQSRTI